MSEYNFPETIFTRDVESRVFQSIVVKCLAEVEGVQSIGGNIFDHLLGRENQIKGIYVEQDEDTQSVSVKIEVNVDYGISIPEKAEEIQKKVTGEITRLTGLHVATVHVIFKGLISEKLIDDPEVEDMLEAEEAPYTEDAFQ